jgi:hypothetical protein
VRSYRLRITPTCISDWRWLAFARWCVASFWARVAFACIDVVFLVSDEVKLEVEQEWKRLEF